MNEEILLDNLNQIKENINQHSPYPDKVKIIAVTKNFSHHAIISAVKRMLFVLVKTVQKKKL